MLDPVKFIERHANVGDPAPQESCRLIAARHEALATARERHSARVARIEQAAKELDEHVQAILEEK